MDRQVRDDQQVFVDIDQLCLYAGLRLDDHAPGDGQRTVQPGRQYRPSVFFNVEFYIPPFRSAVISALGLILNIGESQWLAMI